jgi:hypothetical protein
MPDTLAGRCDPLFPPTTIGPSCSVEKGFVSMWACSAGMSDSIENLLVRNLHQRNVALAADHSRPASLPLRDAERSARGLAAANADDLAGDVAGPVGSHEQNGVGDFLGRGASLHGDGSEKCGLPI